MKVFEIATQADPDCLLAEYQRAYDTLHGYNSGTIARWREEITKATPVRIGMKVIVSHVTEEDGESWYDISGEDGEKNNWSLSLTPWGEWRELKSKIALGAT